MEHPMLKSKCPAYGKICAICKEPNHFAKACPNQQERRKNINHLHYDTDSDELTSGEEFVDALTSPGTSKDVKCCLILNKTEIAFQIDTGASVNVLPGKYHPHDLPLTTSSKTLSAWNSNMITPLGSYRHSVRNPANGRKYSIEFLVVKEDFTPILGLRASQALNFVTINENEFERVLHLDHGKHKDVFDATIGTLPGQHTLRVDNNVQPVVMPDRRIPLSVRPRLKAELDKLVTQGILAPVKEPTPWVSQLVIALKKSGDLRVCIDPRELNKALLRERFTLPILEDTLHAMRSSTVFTKADLAHGYWHVMLDEPSSKLTTFQTCYGRYRWLRLPFGTCVSSEIFQRRLLEALDGLTGVVCVADDIIIHGKTLDDHNDNLEAFLQRCNVKGIRLNKDKLELRKDSITFLGHLITTKGLEADPEKIKAVQQMPNPTNVSQLRTFIGMINYMAKFLPDLAETLKPLTTLTKLNVPWNWSSAEQSAFDKIKSQLTTAPILTFYDPNKPLTLENDASDYGLGSVLKQDDRPVAYASRTLTDTERNYAQIEKEMLAITYGLEKFHHYTYGRNLTVVTDHKPLVAIKPKPLYKAPRRLQSMFLKAQTYDYNLVYAPGTSIPVADALSRAPLNKEDSVGREHEIADNLNFVQVKDRQMDKIKLASKHDEEMIQLRQVIIEGWPEHRNQIYPQLRQYFAYRDEMTVQDGIVLRGQRIVIPTSLRSTMKLKCHAGHLGINSTLRRARDALFWPGMSHDLREYVETCGVCASMPVRLTPEPVIARDAPERPWQRVGSDIMTFNSRQYLVTSDCHSSFFEVDHLPDMSSETVIRKLKKIFARHGIPEELITDSGTQFTAETFRIFTQEWEFDHTLSSPGNHRANGAAEAAVKSAKRLFKKCKAANEDPYLGLLNLRNTPNESTGLSPAQSLFGRRTKSTLPMANSKLTTPMSLPAKTNKENHTASKIREINKDLRDLPTLQPGQTVRLQPIDNSKVWREGIVTKQTDSRTYHVEDKTGRRFRRNRALLRATRKSQHHEHDSNDKLARIPTTPPRPTNEPQPRAAQQAPPDPTRANTPDTQDTSSAQPPVFSEAPNPSETQKTTRSGRVSRPPQYLHEYQTANK
jgi:transposase InsO family protein